MALIKTLRTSDIVYHNRSSTDFGLKILFPVNPPAPTPNKQMLTIPGKSGDWADNNRSYQATETQVNAVIRVPRKYEGNWWTLKGDIENWLYGSEDWLKFNQDPDYLYKAQIVTAPTFTPVNPERVNATITFHFQPFKFKEKTIHYTPIPANGITYNDETVVVKPDWHLKGTGSFMLTVNGMPYEFDDLNGDLYLIGEEGNAYAKDPSIISDDNYLLNTNIRLANNTAPELLSRDNGENYISIAPLDDQSTLEICEFKPLLRRLI